MVKNKRVLITGATGFIGSNIARVFLKEGAVVSVLTRPTSNKWRIENILGDIKEHCADLLNKEVLAEAVSRIRPQIIIHNAVYGAYPGQSDVGKIRQTKFTGTVNLIYACRDIDLELFINTSTSSEYGIKNKPMKEEDALEPINEYGAASVSTTLFCRDTSAKGSLPIVTLRLFSPYGYYEDIARLIPSAIMRCLKKENPKLSSPDSVRDFIFIEDVASAYLKIAQKGRDAGGEIFNIGAGCQYSVGEVVNKIIELTGSKVKPEWGKVPLRQPEPEVWQADISKAKRILGWQPKYNLTEGLKKTVEWFEKNIFLYNEAKL